MSLNIESIKKRLVEFERGVTPEMRRQWHEEAEEERRREILFLVAEEIAEREERKMIEGIHEHKLP